MTDAVLIGPVAAPDLHVMTFNVRRRVPHLGRRSPDLWATRGPVLSRLLSHEQPSVLGVQEALPDQVEFVADSLGPSYRRVGRGRNRHGGGEHCTIFYDSRRLRLTGWAQYSLSDRPDAPGSRSWGNLFPRVVVTAEFRDIDDDARLVVLNTHLDHLSARSRLRSARLLAALARDAGGAVVLLGDANTAAGSAPYRELVGHGGLRDAWLTADARLTEEWGTHSRYHRPRRGGRRIDWILVGPGVRVRSCGINAWRICGAAASDHEPVQAVLRIGAGAGIPSPGG